MAASVEVMSRDSEERDNHHLEGANLSGATQKRQMTDVEEESDRERFGREGIRWLKWVGLAGLIALVVYASRCGEWRQCLSVACVGIMAAGAAFLIGGVLGFLFGIPRTVAGDGRQATTLRESHGAAESTSYLPNTDLEQIADWLTKILVGVGLTQLSSIPLKMTDLGNELAPGLGGSVPLAEGLSVYFVLCGFLIGFLWTRLYLPRALRWSDVASEAMIISYQALAEVKVVQENTDQALAEAKGAQKTCDLALVEAQNMKAREEADNEAWDLVMRQLNPRSGLAEVSEEELHEKIKNATEPTREKVFHEAVMVRSSNWDANKDLMLRTIPIFKALTAIDSENPEYHGELGFALKDKGDYKEAIDQLDAAISKRPRLQIGGGAAWYEFLRAVCRIHLDDNFKRKQPSEGEKKKQISDDLKVAWKSGLKDAMDREGPVLKDWIKCNHLEAADFAKDWVRGAAIAESGKCEVVRQ
jgi:tetratricopeptide (TPR) repeat protein